MTFAYWTILLTAFLPLVWSGAAKFGGGEFDNAKPRLFLQSLTGWQQRADWAQANAFENFPPFAAGVLVAHAVGAPQMRIDILAAVFLVARIAHGIAYILDKPTLRSAVWSTGFLSMVGLFLVAGWAA
jgi:uncharacterized MAPEG superfamily protein